jgi:RNA polymerase sigma-70 factor (ECF subfamily)
MDWYRDHRSENIVEPNEENDLSNISSKDLLETNIESEYVNTQVMSDVTRIMNQLPPSQREVVYMRFYQDMSFKEIAETTGVSINTSLGRMRYAVMNMRKMAKDHQMSLQLEM